MVNRYRMFNIDRQRCLPGLPSEHDFACVADMKTLQPHPLTGEMQPVQVFSGTLTECHAWIRAKADDGKRPCSFCRTTHGSEVVHHAE